MAYIEFKTKAIDIYNIDDTFSHKEVFLPQTIKPEHIKEKDSHRMFTGKVRADIVDIRAKMILKKMGIGPSFRLGQKLENVTVSGEYMLTVKINLI